MGGGAADDCTGAGGGPALQHATTRQVAGFFEGIDVLLLPVLAREPARLGEMRQDDPSLDLHTWWRTIADYAAFTPLWNMTGQPAISLPLHLSPTGLPIGSQLVAAAGAEAVLLRLAAQLEGAAPWADRVPTVHLSRSARAG